MPLVPHVWLSALLLCLSWVWLVCGGVLALPERPRCSASTPPTDLHGPPRGDSTPYGLASTHDPPNLIRCVGAQSYLEARAIVPPNIDSSPLAIPETMTPFSILPIISYTLLALALSYLGLRLARRFNIRLVPSFLAPAPGPVTTKHKAGWWNWNFLRRSWKGRNAKAVGLNLQSVELLPTSAAHTHTAGSSTSLFDLPSSTGSTATLMGSAPGMKMGVFVDSSNVGMGPLERQQLEAGDGRLLSRTSSLDAFPAFVSPSRSSLYAPASFTPPLTAASTIASFPTSPLTPPPLPQQQQLAASKNPFKFSFSLPGILHPHPRAPSPALSLATSPQAGRSHRRSRSLGGVPLRRLSASRLEGGGRPGSPLAGDKRKGKGRQELLIDFSSSGSGSEEEEREERLASSGASSDVGTQAGVGGYGPLMPVPVPLVDLGEVEKAGMRGTKRGWAFDLDFGREEKLVDVDEEDNTPLAVVKESLASGIRLESVEKLVDVESSGAEEYFATASPTEKLVDIESSEPTPQGLVDVESSAPEASLIPPSHGENFVDVEVPEFPAPPSPVEKLVDVDSSEPEPSFDPPPSPVERLVDVEPSEPAASFVPSSTPRVHEPETKRAELSDDEDHRDLQVQESWNWDDDEQDPWAQVESGRNWDLIRFEEEREREVEEREQEVEEEREREVEEEREREVEEREREVEEEREPADEQSLVSIDEESQREAVIELVRELASEGLIPGLQAMVMLVPDSEVVEDEMGVIVMPVEETESDEAVMEEQVEEEEEHGVDADVTLVTPLGLKIDSKNLVHLERSPLISPVDDVLLEKPTALWLFEKAATADVTEGSRDLIDNSTSMEKISTVLPEAEPVVQHAEGPTEPISIHEMLSPMSLKGQPLEPIQDELPLTELASKPDYPAYLFDMEDGSATNINDIYENYDNDTTLVIPPTLELPPLSIPIITVSSAPREPAEEDFPDPDLLPLPSLVLDSVDNETVAEKESPKEPPSQTPTPPASPPMSPLRSIPSSPKKDKETKPAWSLRASDAPTLGLSSANSSPNLRSRKALVPEKTNEETKEPAVAVLSTSVPGSFPEPELAKAKVVEQTSLVPSTAPGTIDSVATTVVPKPALRHRTTRSPIDIALAMQLRPGLGVGADPAWMVRFLMTMFGWLAILISGQGEF